MEVDVLIPDPMPAWAGTVNAIRPVNTRITAVPQGTTLTGTPFQMMAVAINKLTVIAGLHIPQTRGLMFD